MCNEFNHIICESRRFFYKKLWNNFKDYADTNFCKEFNTYEKKYQRLWEMYLCNVLLEKKFNIIHGKKLNPPIPNNEGPDFITGDNIYIECIYSTKGEKNKPDSVNPPYASTINDMKLVQISGCVDQYKEMKKLGITFLCDYLNNDKNSMIIDIDVVRKILLRISNSITEKYNKYKKWNNKQWFCHKNPYIIAINTFELNYIHHPDMPYVLKTVFGADKHIFDIDKKEHFYTFRKDINKSSGSEVCTGYFCNDKYNEISGILFSNEDCYSYKDKIGNDCFLIKNPYAKNKIPDIFSSKFNEFSMSENGNTWTLKKELR